MKIKKFFKKMYREYQKAYLLTPEQLEFVRVNQKMSLLDAFLHSFFDGLKYLIAIGGFYLFFNSFFFEIIKGLPDICSMIKN